MPAKKKRAPSQAEAQDSAADLLAQARAMKAAAAAAQGKSTTAIAEELGVSRSQAWRILKAEEVQQILVLLVNDRYDAINLLFGKALTVIEEALGAERPWVVTAKGEVIEGGPDHFARLTAVARLIKLLTAGRATPKPPEGASDGTLTLQQIEAQVDDSGA